jgi:uncharacterized protein YbbK (DUF523 family)
MDKEIKIGISACLLGQMVRYDGAQKFDPELVEALGRLFTLIPVCPEVGCGLPVPREAMRLEGDPDEPRLMTIESRIDLTDRMRSYCREKVAQLEREQLCGFVFKKNSPSSGLHQVPVYLNGVAAAHGRGLFAAEVVKRFPALPVDEAESLADPVLRGKFIQEALRYCRSNSPLCKGGAGGFSPVGNGSAIKSPQDLALPASNLRGH